MSLLAAVFGFLTSILSFLKGDKDRRIGADEQKLQDLKVKNEVQDAVAQADTAAPATVDELKNRLDKGTL